MIMIISQKASCKTTVMDTDWDLSAYTRSPTVMNTGENLGITATTTWTTLDDTRLGMQIPSSDSDNTLLDMTTSRSGVTE